MRFRKRKMAARSRRSVEFFVNDVHNVMSIVCLREDEVPQEEDGGKKPKKR